MTGRMSPLANDVFYVCSLVERIGRARHRRRHEVIDALGPGTIEHALKYADVFHSESIEKVADELADEHGIDLGSFDNVSDARYTVPSHWDMGQVYKRLALGIMRAKGCSAPAAISEAFHSPIAPLLDDYNGTFYCENPDNILLAHLEGEIE